MTTYSVILDTNTSSDLLKKFENLELAKQFAIDELENTNPENDSEGINIYTEEGMIMSLSKGQDITLIDPKTSMQIGTEKL